MPHQQNLINLDLNINFPQAVKGKGVYLFDGEGNRFLDGCSGALVANLGHGVAELGRAMARQATQLDYVYRVHFSSPVAEELAARYCNLTREPMGRVYFTNSGSEAMEMAVKLARARHLAAGEQQRQKIISRWQSYHGITMGALSWSGVTARRADYEPYLKNFVHIPPCYCYRCWFGREPQTCSLECAQSLENAILNQGAETVSAFIMEPVVGAALAAAYPPEGYFRAVREICDRHDVMLIFDEVMTGAGRIGGSFFACDHFPGRPDIIAFGKGVGGGYYPLAGVLVSREVSNSLARGSGSFSPGQSHAGHPIGMAAGLAVLDYIGRHDLLNRAAAMGKYLVRQLASLLDHPTVGDIRGKGLMWGLEFVRDKKSKESFNPAGKYHMKIYEAARRNGLIFLPSGGCDRGYAGDMALLGPPLTITEEQIDELCGALDTAITQVEKEIGF
jgi:adenosylmethionine-8-amino-7-oxononanoate aminotransferase